MLKGKLYLVSGASGAGKSTIVNAIARIIPNFVVLKKATTRNIRPQDSNEDAYYYPTLRDLKSNNRFVIYATNGNILYGVDTSEIKDIIESGRNALLVSVHNGARHQLEEKLGRDQVVEIFIHRDLDLQMKKLLMDRGGLRRLVVRERIYEGIATGTYQPDYIILNHTTIERAVEQFRLIVNTDRCPPRWNFRDAPGVLHIIVAATGILRDVVQDAPFAIPYWGQAYCKKGTPTPEEVKQNPLPAGWMEHTLFGRYYRLDPQVVIQKLRTLKVAFVMFSDIASARQLQTLVQNKGFDAPIHYLHQDQTQVDDSVQTFPECEWEARLKHAKQIQELYEKELILESHPVLLVNGEESALDWCYRQINERPRWH